MNKFYALVFVLPLLGACTNGIDDAWPLLTKIQETAGKVEDATLGNAKKGFEAYCQNTPDAVRDKARERFNSFPGEYKLPDICVRKDD